MVIIKEKIVGDAMWRRDDEGELKKLCFQRVWVVVCCNEIRDATVIVVL